MKVSIYITSDLWKLRTHWVKKGQCSYFAPDSKLKIDALKYVCKRVCFLESVSWKLLEKRCGKKIGHFEEKKTNLLFVFSWYKKTNFKVKSYP